MKIRAILLIPPPLKEILLEPGKFGGRMPMAGDLNLTGQWELCRLSEDDQLWSKRALILAWEGVPCLAGCETAQRALAYFEDLNPRSGVLFRDNGTPGECYLQVGSQPIGRSWAVTYGPYKQDSLNGVPHHQVQALAFRDTPVKDPLVREWKLAHVLAARLGGEALILP